MRKFILLSLLFLPSLSLANEAIFADYAEIPDWAQNPAKTLQELKIIKGDDGTKTFRPYGTINRAEFCKILVLTTAADIVEPLEPSFPDVNAEDWFFPYVETAKKNHWLDGYPDGYFRPGNTLNRAEAAKILVNAFEFSPTIANAGAPWYEQYFLTLDKKNLLAHNTKWENIAPDTNPSRAEIVEQIYRFLLKVLLPDADTSSLTFSSNDASNTPSSFNTQVSDNPTFEYVDETVSEVPIDRTAGKIEIVKSSGQKESALVKPGDKNIKVHETKFIPKNGKVKIGAIQYRRIGNGKISNYSNIWIEKNGTRISPKIRPTEDLVRIKFDSLQEISSTTNFSLKIDISDSAKKSNSRFTLFLPNWVDANAETKCGLFPFGGTDIAIY